MWRPLLIIIFYHQYVWMSTSPLLVVETPEDSRVYRDVCAQEESDEIGLHMQQHCEGVRGIPVNVSNAGGF